MAMSLEEEIRSAINRYSAENTSNTPDFILAQYMISCLAAFDQAVQQRETWYGRDARPSSPDFAFNNKREDTSDVVSMRAVPRSPAG